MLTELIAGREEPGENGNGNGNGLRRGGRTTRTSPTSIEEDVDEGRRRGGRRRPRSTIPGAVRRYRFRHPTASGKTIAAAGFVEAARTMGVLILTHRRLLVSAVHARPHDRGLRRPASRPAIEKGQEPLRGNPITIQTYAWFARHVGSVEQERVPARHLRRGAHGARREDERARSAASPSPSTSG